VAKINEIVAELNERVNGLVERINAANDAHAANTRALVDLHREYEREIALLKRDVDDLKKWKDDHKKERDETSRRLWAFGPNLLAAIVNVLLAALVAYFVANR
jgi:predicted  nucleic acid-binding Zn-ribbon protein